MNTAAIVYRRLKRLEITVLRLPSNLQSLCGVHEGDLCLFSGCEGHWSFVCLSVLVGDGEG